MAVLLHGIDPEADRLRIRALRAQPPGHAAHDPERRRVFAAALGQFDELLTASAAVGPATRPLPLYYALNQAGRAIAAAKQAADRPWQPRSHGLEIGDPDPRFLGQTTITPRPRKKDGRDSFSILTETERIPARSFGPPSSGLRKATTLSNVWAAIPDAPRPGLGGGCPRAISLSVNEMASAIVDASIHGLQIPPTAAAKDKIREMIEDLYPTAATGISVDSVINDLPPYTGTRAELSWHHPGQHAKNDGSHRPVNEDLTQYLWRGVGGGWWLVPRVNDAEVELSTGDVLSQGDVLSPLLLWWCLLHALSQIARYHSADWLAALDPDRSTEAVAIEAMLSTALAVLPRLVLLALSQGPLPRPSGWSSGS